MNTLWQLGLLALVLGGAALVWALLGAVVLWGWDRWQLVRGTKKIRR